MNDYKHNFGWGDTRGIREIMVRHAKGLTMWPAPWGNFGYPDHGGDPGLVAATRKLIKDLTGKEYKYVLITNGATNALNAYIHARKEEETHELFTNKIAFLLYPVIARNHGLYHMPHLETLSNLKLNHNTRIVINDSPSNPTGTLSEGGLYNKGVIWDAAYYTPTYCGVRIEGKLVCPPIMPNAEAMAGSLSKLTGINGLRIGWLATNKLHVYSKALEYLTADLCGVSYPSQHAALHILESVDLQQFYVESKALLDANREQMGRLNHLFSNQDIFPRGMYALFEVDNGLKDLLERASVQVMSGRAMGDTRDSVRFNLANPYSATKEMVEAILKADKV